ncbi:hypothetical protein NMG60_11031357 [Bertholletia excelsa]
MDVEVPELLGGGSAKVGSEEDRLSVKRKTLEAVLHQCQRALELLSSTGFDYDGGGGSGGSAAIANGATLEDGQEAGEGSSSPCSDQETEELCDLLKSRLECPDFLRKLESAQSLAPQNIAEEGSSWDLINDSDIWEGECTNLDQEDYIVVKQEDIVDGIACFMAAYLLSLKQTKDLTPNQLQEALSKTFSVKKKKGKLRKAWDGTKVIYNVASWGATAIGIYQNPVLLRAASSAFWTSCHVISKLF